jgi:hypothetical protein
VVSGSPLTDVGEAREAILLYNLLMTERENRYYQFKSGNLDAQSWEGGLAARARISSLPMFEQWRSTPGAENHSAEFLELVDELAIQSFDD